jgi:hypothetical protein
VKTFSATQTAAMGAQETGEEPLVALTIEHAGLATPIRIIDYGSDVVKDGDTFSWWPLRVTLPASTKDELPSVQVEIDAADRTLGDALRALTGDPPSVSFEIVLASSPDTTESGPYHFELRSLSGDASTLRGELALPAILDEPAYARMTPATHPGLYPT